MHGSLYYRLSRRRILPRHWSYAEAWERDDETGRWIDQRAPGFQVWMTLGAVLTAAMGKDRDGDYTARDYPWLLLVRATDTRDSAGEWLAVRPRDVTSVRALPTTAAIAAVHAASRRAYGSFWEPGRDVSWADLEAWIDDHEAALQRRLLALGARVPRRTEETLPRPRRHG